jgi:dipeptide transport system permease protein
MLRFLLRRIGMIIPTFVAVTFLSFLLIRLVPGDPIEVRVGERGIAPERLAELRHEYGLDQPLWRQFVDYEMQVAQGDLGTSVVTHSPVWSEFAELFPATLELGICAMLFAVLVGMPLGMIAAVKRGSVFDYGLMGLSVTGASMPIFWWGLMMILVFSVSLGWTPVAGRIGDVYFVEPVTGFMLIDTLLSDEQGAFGSAVSHLILPTVVLGTIPLATVARMTRSSMLEVLGEDYIRTARAKGLSENRVVWKHGMRAALTPLVSQLGADVALLLGGAIVIEQVYGLQGVGALAVQAVNNQDRPIIIGVVLLGGFFIVLANIVIDIAYVLLDPRVR